MREVSTSAVNLDELQMKDTQYITSCTEEHFLEWVTGEDKIAGFLRLSLPDNGSDAAMIREVHVYGTVASFDSSAANSQHHGLGRKLVARAEEIARDAGYTELRVISSIGTREYYKHLGFTSFTADGLYQKMNLCYTNSHE
jgi:elongator complex protein 3